RQVGRGQRGDRQEEGRRRGDRHRAARQEGDDVQGQAGQGAEAALSRSHRHSSTGDPFSTMYTHRILRAGLLAAPGLLLAAAARARWCSARPGFKKGPKRLAQLRSGVAKPPASTVRVRWGDKECALGTGVGADGWIITKASELKPGQVV